MGERGGHGDPAGSPLLPRGPGRVPLGRHFRVGDAEVSAWIPAHDRAVLWLHNDCYNLLVSAPRLIM